MGIQDEQIACMRLCVYLCMCLYIVINNDIWELHFILHRRFSSWYHSPHKYINISYCHRHSVNK